MRRLIRPRRPLLPSCIHVRKPFLVTTSRHRGLSTSSPVCLGPTKATTAVVHTTEPKGLKPSKPSSLPDRPCRTRFAPSPTGYLHLGSLRTALFNFLLAKATGGQFILRIEDTDQARTVPGAESRLYQDLKWAGLSWDEGPDVAGPYGPYRQSERLDLYHQHARILLNQGKAYRCFCSPEVLQEHRSVAHEHGGSTNYPGTCRSISPEESEERASNGEPHAIRFLSPDTSTRFVDLVYGVSRDRNPSEDFVIIKRDGFPTYHFANVVDDKHMKITHVIRGAEWLISTPKHVAMYQAFGWQPPAFAHVGLLVDHDRQKLSKRHAGVDISEYQAKETLPAALLNFSVLLGWSKAQAKGANSDVMSLQDMIDNFTLKFTKGDIKVDFGKLAFLQEQHVRRITNSVEELIRQRERYVVPIDEAFRTVQTSLENTTWPGPIPLGAPVPAMASNDQAARERYVANAILIARRKAAHAKSQGGEHAATSIAALDTPQGDAEGFLSAHRYLFWDIPPDVLQKAFAWRGRRFESLPSKAEVSFSAALESLKWSFLEMEEDRWTNEALASFIKSAAHELVGRHVEGDATKLTVYHVLRFALYGGGQGPSIPQVMVLLGKDETIKRIQTAMDAVESLDLEDTNPGEEVPISSDKHVVS